MVDEAQVVDEFALGGRRRRRKEEEEEGTENLPRSEKRRSEEERNERGERWPIILVDDGSLKETFGERPRAERWGGGRGGGFCLSPRFHRKPNRYRGRLLTRNSLLFEPPRKVQEESREAPHDMIRPATQISQDARNYGHPIISYASRYLYWIERAPALFLSLLSLCRRLLQAVGLLFLEGREEGGEESNHCSVKRATVVPVANQKKEFFFLEIRVYFSLFHLFVEIQFIILFSIIIQLLKDYVLTFNTYDMTIFLK